MRHRDQFEGPRDLLGEGLGHGGDHVGGAFHQGRFDVRSGKPTCDPATQSIRSYPVKIDAGRVYLALD